MRVVVTGAASGIGTAVVRQVAAQAGRNPASRMLLVDSNADRLAAVAEEIGPNAAPCVTDVSLADCGDRVASAAIEHMGGIDGLVSNAGIILGGALSTLSLDDYDRIFAINTRATWLLAKACYPHLKASGGALVATGSISAHHPTPPLGMYSASKAALVMMVRQMANEWGPEGIRCNTVSPGPTLTSMTAAGYADVDRRHQREMTMPLRRLGTADDVANAILFLLSDAAKQITGLDLLVDGGIATTLMTSSGAGAGQTAGDE